MKKGYTPLTVMLTEIQTLLHDPDQGIYAFPEGSTVIALIVRTPAFLMPDEIHLVAAKIQQRITDRTGLSMTLGIGTRAPTAEDVCQSWRNATIAAKYRMIFGWGQIIGYDAILSRVGQAPVYPESEFRKVLQAFVHLDAAGFENQLSLLMIAGYTQSVVFGQSLMRQTVAELYRSMSPERQQECNAGYIQLVVDLEACETRDEQFLLIFDFYLSQMQSTPPVQRHEESCHDVLQFISDHLSDPDLSMLSLAEHLGVSQSSVRNIFKENNLPPPKVYIQSLRMDKACELLRETDLTAREIGEKVGFLESRYFYVAFKKQTGMTAYAYREKARIQHD